MPSKQRIAWTLVTLGLAGVALSYWGIWVLVAYFAAGLVWYASLALLISGPVAAVGAGVARRQPRQHAAMWFGVSAFVAWVTLWVLMLTKLGFTFGG
jgi:hypothetical protein